MRKILFLCTGNYYRSRFAEEYFNHLALEKGLKWKAYSRGLSLNIPNSDNPGPISDHALLALSDRQIPGKNLKRHPEQVKEMDFKAYDKIIALSEKEHRPILKSRFNQHLDKIEFFEIGDLPIQDPQTAMNELATMVEKLADQLT